MWSEDDLSSDLIRIRDKQYANLAFQSKTVPDDPFLRWRYLLVQLLVAFEQNDFARQRSLADPLVDPLWEIITSFDETHLISEMDLPPFDLFVLVFMVSKKPGSPNENLLIGLLQYYQNAAVTVSQKRELMWYMNDRNLRQDIACDRAGAQAVVQSRIDYLAELVASILYTNGQYQLLQAFLTDLCPPGFTITEETLSHIGRIAYAIGDSALAGKYFSGVREEALVTANSGYKNFFDGNFEQAKRDFQTAENRGPRNIDACSKHLGTMEADPIEANLALRRESPEDKTQWPAQPKARV